MLFLDRIYVCEKLQKFQAMRYKHKMCLLINPKPALTYTHNLQISVDINSKHRFPT